MDLMSIGGHVWDLAILKCKKCGITQEEFAATPEGHDLTCRPPAPKQARDVLYSPEVLEKTIREFAQNTQRSIDAAYFGWPALAGPGVEATLVGVVKDPDPPKAGTCECGAHATKEPHANWCPLYKDLT